MLLGQRRMSNASVRGARRGGGRVPGGDRGARAVPRLHLPLHPARRHAPLPAHQRRAGVRRRRRVLRLPRRRPRRDAGQGGRGKGPRAGALRQPDRAAEPQHVPRPSSTARSRAAGATTRRSRSTSSTSTASRRSTTRSATAPATSCSRRWRSACARRVRENDMVARLGGDEFVVIARRRRRRRRARRRSRSKLLAALGEPMTLHGHALPRHRQHRHRACSRPTATTRRRLLKHADAAMYRAKEKRQEQRPVLHRRAGRARGAPVRARVGAAAARSTRGELLLHFQPKIDIAGGRMVGVEALLRWQHPTRGLVPPMRVHPAGRGARPDRADRPLGAARPHAGRSAPGATPACACRRSRSTCRRASSRATRWSTTSSTR